MSDSLSQGISDVYQASQRMELANEKSYESPPDTFNQKYEENKAADPAMDDAATDELQDEVMASQMVEAGAILTSMSSQASGGYGVDPRSVSEELGEYDYNDEYREYRDDSQNPDEDDDLPHSPFPHTYNHQPLLSQQSLVDDMSFYGRALPRDFKDSRELHLQFQQKERSYLQAQRMPVPRYQDDTDMEVEPVRKKKKPTPLPPREDVDILDLIIDQWGLKFCRSGLEGKPRAYKRVSTMSYLTLGLVDKHAQKLLETAQKSEEKEGRVMYKGRPIHHAADAFPLTLSGDGTGINAGIGRLQNVLGYPKDSFGVIRTLQLKVPMRYTVHMHITIDPKVAQQSYQVADINQLVVFCDIDHKMINMDCQRINASEIALKDFHRTEKDGNLLFKITFPIDLRVNADNKKKRDRKVYDCYQAYLAQTTQPAAQGERRVKRKLKEQEQNMAITFGIRSPFANAGATGPRFVEEVLWRCDNFVVANVQKDLHFDGLVEKDATGPGRFHHENSQSALIRNCECAPELMDVVWDS